MDLGEVDGELFAVMAGMGFDAAVMDSASATLKARIGPLAYVLSAVPHLFGRPMRVQVRVDDDTPVRRNARAVLVGNVGRLQGGIRLLPDAEPDNGRMDVAILAPQNLAHWAALAVAVLLRRERVPRMEVIRGSHITISSDRPQPRELDGDVIAAADTLKVTVRPGALWLCVPQPGLVGFQARASPAPPAGRNPGQERARSPGLPRRPAPTARAMRRGGVDRSPSPARQRGVGTGSALRCRPAMPGAAPIRSAGRRSP